MPRHARIDRTRRRCAARALCLEQMMSARARLILWLVLMSLAGIWLWWAAGSRLQMATDITALLPQTAPDAVTTQALTHDDTALGQRRLSPLGPADLGVGHNAAGIFTGTRRAPPPHPQ